MDDWINKNLFEFQVHYENVQVLDHIVYWIHTYNVLNFKPLMKIDQEPLINISQKLHGSTVGKILLSLFLFIQISINIIYSRESLQSLWLLLKSWDAESTLVRVRPYGEIFQNLLALGETFYFCEDFVWSLGEKIFPRTGKFFILSAYSASLLKMVASFGFCFLFVFHSFLLLWYRWS